MSAPSIHDLLHDLAQPNADYSAIANDLEDVFAILEAHECWDPYFRVLDFLTRNPNSSKAEYFIRMARVQRHYLEDVFAASETCAMLVRTHQISYQEFRGKVLPQVLGFEDWTAEAAILSAIESHFVNKHDSISCLERLCLLYEKKINNDHLLAKSNERLISIDQNNVKALRYFKLRYVQENSWEEVVRVLKELMILAPRPQEAFRYAQELAAVLLYQLEMPKESLEILNNYCSESPLNTSMIRFDAYHRMANWRGCLRVLYECLLSVDQESERGTIHLKIGQIHEELSEFKEAKENFILSFRLAPHIFDSIEGIISVLIKLKDWSSVIEWMNVLVSKSDDMQYQSQLRQAIRRLQEGLKYAQS